MTCPNILLLAAFLLLLSFWVDLCHQSNDDGDDDDGYNPQESLLEKKNKAQSEVHSGRKCCSFPAIHVILIVFTLTAASAVLIWIGKAKIPIDRSLVARVYVDIFAVAFLLLGGALACYGLVLFLKMSKVRSERVSSEKWKVAGLAIVTVFCFTSNALTTIFSEIPFLYNWRQQQTNIVRTLLLLVLNYFIGSSVPSAFLLWVMRELPPTIVINREEESRTIAFVSDSLVAVHPQRWTTVTSSQNQVSRASPI
ncbi:hypothetical protein M9H77_11177 [Catharanthus roseus]|uniref:Uncharacterized protein n=1 Tax=Catharanthus roseus TaxID=4058 RepID=A0ACC0BDW3_CATRO|nr:hypothetical protein M9H77_11177 [Catharanthus roseus]